MTKGRYSPAGELQNSTIVTSGQIGGTMHTAQDAASQNFSVAKVVAIFTVVSGHWFTGTVLWVPVTFGLFIFAFSSAYFTARLYGVNVDRNRFWRKKLERLAVRYWVALLFLAIVLLASGRPVFHWHSIIHFTGLSGVLNWIGIPNDSALGAGLWFFTLLLLFYIAYPLLAKLLQSRFCACFVSIIGFIAAVSLEESLKVGHELWLTTFGFILGVVFGLHEPSISPRSSFLSAGAFGVTLLLLNLLWDVKQFNTFLILSTSIALATWIRNAEVPTLRIMKEIGKLEKYLLEIFLVHTYLFVHFVSNRFADFFISCLLIVIVSVALYRFAMWLRAKW